MLTLLQLKTKVIFTGHPKISQIFTNHIMWCKKWSLKPFACHCHKASLLLIMNINLSKNNPHVLTLGHTTSSKFDRVLHSNMNNVAVPNIRSFPETFLASFCQYTKLKHFLIAYMNPLRCRTRRHMSKFLRTKHLTNFTPLCPFSWNP